MAETPSRRYVPTDTAELGFGQLYQLGTVPGQQGAEDKHRCFVSYGDL
jgi:hypothetical protein